MIKTPELSGESLVFIALGSRDALTPRLIDIILSIGSPTVETSDVDKLVALQSAGACDSNTIIGSIVSRVIAASDRVEDSPFLLLSPQLGIILQLRHHASQNLWILLANIGRLIGVV